MTYNLQMISSEISSRSIQFVQISLARVCALPRIDGCACYEWSKTDENSNLISGFIIVAAGYKVRTMRGL